MTLDVSTAQSITLNGQDVTKITDGTSVLWEALPQLPMPSMLNRRNSSDKLCIQFSVSGVSGVTYYVSYRASTSTPYPSCSSVTTPTKTTYNAKLTGSGSNSEATLVTNYNATGNYLMLKVLAVKEGYRSNDPTLCTAHCCATIYI